MAAFDFPNSPSVNDQYTANGVTFKWNGTIWQRISASSGAQGTTGSAGPTGAQGAAAGLTISTSAPGSPSAGDMWWDSDAGLFLTYYNDGNSSQWVELNQGPKGAQGATGPTGAQGATGSTGAQGAAGAQGATGAAGSNASISSNADNRVITGGSGTNLVGESGLTYDGTTLDITGALAFTSAPAKAITLADNKRIYFGDGDDMWIGSNGSNGEVSGSLWLYNHLYLYDAVRLRIGNSQDLELYHLAGGDSYVDSNSGQLYVRSNQNIYIQPADNENAVVAIANGNTELYHNNNIRAYTAADGFALSRVNTFSNPNNTGSETLGAMLDIGGNIHLQEVHPTGAYTDRCDLVLNTNSGYGTGLSDKIRITAGGRVVIYSSTQRTYNKGWAPGNLVLQNNSNDNSVDFTQGILFTDNANNQSNGGWMHAAICTVGTTGYNGNICFGVDGNGAANNNTGGLTEKMRLLHDGRLHVQAATFGSAIGSSNAGVQIADSNSGTLFAAGGTTTQNQIIFLNPNGVVGRIQSTGSSTSFVTSSDYRLKENAVSISDGITRLKTLNPYRFNFKVDAETTLDGFFAHEVQTVVPEAVDGTKDELFTEDNKFGEYEVGDAKYQSIDHSKLVPLLTAALQEAVIKIETLEVEVAALKSS